MSMRKPYCPPSSPSAVMLVLVLAACSSATPTPAPTISPTTSPVSTPILTYHPSPSPDRGSSHTLRAPASTTDPNSGSCHTARTHTDSPEPAVNYFEGVPGIVDPTNFGWPREVEGCERHRQHPEQAAADHHSLRWPR